jgi:hypothetical protein
MAQLRLPITSDGPTLPVMIGLPSQMMASLQAMGQPISAPLQVRGVIDTGTDVTAVSANLLRQLGVTSAASGTTNTVTGPVRVNLYEISLSVPASTPPASFLVVRPDLIVMELTAVLPDVDLLLGRDILDECLFFYDGPARQFLLAC